MRLESRTGWMYLFEQGYFPASVIPSPGHRYPPTAEAPFGTLIDKDSNAFDLKSPPRSYGLDDWRLLCLLGILDRLSRRPCETPVRRLGAKD